MIVERLPDDLRPYEGRKPHLFASFAYQDVPRVEPWLRALAAAGVRVWFDRGTGWDRPGALERAIALSAGVLHFRSEHSLESRSVQEEIERAREAGRTIFVVMLDSGAAPADAAAALPGDADPARLVAAIPAEVRNIPRGERLRDSPPTADAGRGERRRDRPPAANGRRATAPDLSRTGAVSDRNRCLYLLMAVVLGVSGLQFLYARRLRLFAIQLVLFLTAYAFLAPEISAGNVPDDGLGANAFGIASVANTILYLASWFLSVDGDGLRMPFFSPKRR